MTSTNFIPRRCNRFSSIALHVVALSIVAMDRPSRAEDWPFARHDVLGTGRTSSVVTDNPETLWTFHGADDAGFDAGPVVADGIVYVGDTAGVFYALRLNDGSIVWKKAISDTSFGAAAAIDEPNHRLYVGDLEGMVRCLALADGTEIWKAELDGEVYAGPMMFEDTVLVTSESGTLACYDSSSGEERWRFSIEAPLRCTPTVAQGMVMLAGCDSKLHFIDAQTGDEVGIVEIDGPTGCTAAVRDRRAYFGTEGGTFYAIDIRDSDSKPSGVAWTFRDARRGQPIRAGAALGDDLVVYGSQGKAIYGLDTNTGDEKWKHVTRSRIESSPVIAGNRVVAATTGGIVFLIDLANGNEIWKADLGGSFVASPAVIDGKIVIGSSDGSLYCFGTRHAADVNTSLGSLRTSQESE